jgi:(p)ppGpp synthase/HD superfamily hydrolase
LNEFTTLQPTVQSLQNLETNDSLKVPVKLNGLMNNGHNGINIKIETQKNLFMISNSNSTLQINYANCCYPIPGDHIFGRIFEDNRIVEIHRDKCLKLHKLKHGNYPSYNGSPVFLELDWEQLKTSDTGKWKDFISKLIITGDDRPNLIKDITSCISEHNELNIKGISFNTTEEGFIGQLTISIPDKDYLMNIRKELLAINGIKSINRYLE